MLVNIISLSSFVKVSKEGLSVVGAACDLLDDREVTVDELWPGRRYALASLRLDPSMLLKAKKELDHLKEASRTLTKLQSSLGAKIDLMERSIVPASRQHGFHSLPNELLIRIVKAAYQVPCVGSDLDRTAIAANDCLRRLAHVNRCLRAIIQNMPELWADAHLLHNFYPPYSCRRNANGPDGAAQIGLITHLTEYRGLASHISSISRWETLNITGQKALKGLDNERFGSLKTLSFMHTGTGNIAPYYLSHLEALLNPSSVPVLKELHISLPFNKKLYPLRASLITPLTSLSLCEYYLNTDSALNGVFETLSSGHNLHQLTFECVAEKHAINAATQTPSANIQVNNLEVFRYGFKAGTSGFDHQKAIALAPVIPSVLVMPKLRHLSVTSSVKFSMESAFPPELDRDYSSVEKLEVDFSCASWEIFIPYMSTAFPHVWSLRLAGFVQSMYDIPGAKELAQLRELTIKTQLGRSVRSVLEQDIVNLERLEVTDASDDPRQWTDFFKRKLRSNVFVEFS